MRSCNGRSCLEKTILTRGSNVFQLGLIDSQRLFLSIIQSLIEHSPRRKVIRQPEKVNHHDSAIRKLFQLQKMGCSGCEILFIMAAIAKCTKTWGEPIAKPVRGGSERESPIPCLHVRVFHAQGANSRDARHGG